MENKLSISERFLSFQGEGKDVGRPTFFIRVAGCNLAVEKQGCAWCDTKYSQKREQGEEMSFEEIFSKVTLGYPKLLCVTGGEPLYHEEMVAFLNFLLGHYDGWISVETNGSIPLPRGVGFGISWSMDIKCPSSDMAPFNCYDNILRLHREDQLKFVIGDEADYDFAKWVLEGYPTCLAQVIFQPAYKMLDPALLAEWLLRDRLDARLVLQQHKAIWGLRRGV